MPLSDPVLWVELAMLSALLTAGICVAWTDLRFQRVPNRYTLGLLGVGVAGRIAMAGLGVGGWNQADQERVNLLRERAASGAGPGTVALTRALPVVPFLVAGGLATAAFGGHLAPPVRALLVWING